MAQIGYIQITRQCNQECRFCSNPPNENILTLAEAKRSIDELKESGYTGVILTGGEPTLFEDLAELIHYAHESSLHPRIISNGQLLSNRNFLGSLVDSGLDHIHLSIHSYKSDVQNFLSNKNDSHQNLVKALENCGFYNITVNINTVICKHNADHLHGTVEWLVSNFPFIRHFVWNNMDPFMNRVEKNPDVIPGFQDFEISLYKAAQFLKKNNYTFRIERVPLCYMTEFAEFSTETRKIVKDEKRTVYFLDQRKKVSQDNFNYEKIEVCTQCSLDAICAGVYGGDSYFSFDEIFPVFVNSDHIIEKIQKDS